MASIRDPTAETTRSVMKSLLLLCFALAPLRADDGATSPEPADEARISYEGAQLLKVTAPSEEKEVALRTLQDMEGVDTWLRLATNSSTVDVMVRPENADKVKEFLDGSGLTFDVIIDNLQAAIDTENPTMTTDEMEELEGRKGHRMTWQSYHRLADIYGYLDYLAQTYPQLVTIQTIGNSIEGRPLKVLKISSGRPGSPAIWIDGGIHAREWIAPASVTYIINELIENRDAHGESVKDVDWYILPVVNPDGYEYSHRIDRLWRKNRRGSGYCAGIDLNRNFGYKWGGAGSSREPCKEIFAGSSAFSEPETAALSKFVSSHTGTLKAYVTFHSYGQYILHPWGYAVGYPHDHADLSRVGQKIASAMYQAGGASYKVGGAAATLYPASGGSDDWAKGAAGIKYSYTIELRDRGYFGFILPVQYIIPTGRESLAAVKVLADEIANGR
ncbi:carboxypeptidase B-like [Zootermopsis nevadensis]|uniref:Carboxypeptidase B n=1 Tax=Zootermopsis nevadensis TaxID=136037 RepID=A0A067RD23_ZOONE|nr:carboxypeptidase B-like [Zootermopsis nevadensis]KDR21622.1 Carboxypeptidase B [Zootermopsis nevadensis]